MLSLLCVRAAIVCVCVCVCVAVLLCIFDCKALLLSARASLLRVLGFYVGRRYAGGLGPSRVLTRIPTTRRLGQWVSLR